MRRLPLFHTLSEASSRWFRPQLWLSYRKINIESSLRPLQELPVRGILYVRFAEKARPVRTVISSLTGVLGTIRLLSHPNPKASLTGAGRAMRLSVPPSGSFTAAAAAYFLLSVPFFPYFLPLLSFLTRGRERKHKQGKKQNTNESMRTRFRF